MQSFDGKTALISGSSSGIGLALAKALAAKGASVAICGTSEAKLAAAKAEIETGGAKVLSLAFDVADEKAWRGAAEETQAKLGPIRFLGLNAGIGGGGRGFEDGAHATAWQASWNINVMGALFGLKACLPAMRQSDEAGHVMITASIAAAIRGPMMGAYGVTKGAVLELAESLRVDLQDTPVTTSVLIPGPVRTKFTDTTARHSEGPGDPQMMAMMAEFLDKTGLPPDAVAAFALDRVAQGAFYIFTHTGLGDQIAVRAAEFSAAAEIGLAPMPPLGPPPPNRSVLTR